MTGIRSPKQKLIKMTVLSSLRQSIGVEGIRTPEWLCAAGQFSMAVPMEVPDSFRPLRGRARPHPAGHRGRQPGVPRGQRLLPGKGPGRHHLFSKVPLMLDY